MAKSEKKDWVSQTKGTYNMVKLNKEQTGTILQFEYDNKAKETQFCELGELTYVAESYFRSAIKLASQVDGIEKETNIKSQYDLSFYFLPAMFCFRHYVELKLKIIFLDMKKDQFMSGHDLEKIKNEIESMGFTKNCFKEAIEFIDSYENKQVEFFRYLLDQANRFTKEFKIANKLKEKMTNIYTNIEYYTGLYFANKFIQTI